MLDKCKTICTFVKTLKLKCIKFQNRGRSINSCWLPIMTREYHSIVNPGTVSNCRLVPDHISKPSYAMNPNSVPLTNRYEDVKTEQEIEAMRHSGLIAYAILRYARTLVKPGITTDEIDMRVHEMIIKQGAYPSPLLYKGFPKSICTSVNNIACHGIPDDRQLLDGDVVNIDITVYYNGFHGDCSDTFLIGEVDIEAKLLVEMTQACRDAAIAKCGPGVPLNTIGQTIQDMADSANYNLVEVLIGHGIGRSFHSLPNILHYSNNEPGSMKEGMTFTIEPVLSEGSGEIKLLSDGWSLATVDDSRTAQSEHTILITGHGAEILTAIDY